MAKDKEDRYWCDQLLHKHECFGYERTHTVKLKIDGKAIELLTPAYFPKLKPLKAVITDDILFVMGTISEEWGDIGRLGGVVVAKREQGDQFSAVVFHETYPWAPEKLGLVKPKKRKAAATKPAAKKAKK